MQPLYSEPTVLPPPDTLPSLEAFGWEPGAHGVDLRTHVYDHVTQEWLLVNSGSQITAYPPEPGDQEDPHMCLKAVNGTKIKCFGYKKIEVRIGRKTYGFQAVKAQVESPVLGWDFVTHHRLNLIWNDEGELTINDRKSNSNTKLKYKALPFNLSKGHEKLCPYQGVELVLSPWSVRSCCRLLGRPDSCHPKDW